MASDTAASSGLAVNDCAGFAEPADILSRLTPDDLHPARLAGPHAWHPWGLTVSPPTDRRLRLTLPAGTRPHAGDQLLERLEAQLGRTPWPPTGRLNVRRRDGQLHCSNANAQRSLIEIETASEVSSRQHAEVVTRDGWPILDELATLNDRTRCISVEEPRRTDFADLASWVEHRMADITAGQRVVTPLPQLLAAQAREHPASADRLRTILAHRTGAAVHQPRALDYLAEQLDHCRTRGHGQRR
jgi:hypothetical protein